METAKATTGEKKMATKFVNSTEDGKMVAAELFSETGKPQFVCDGGWGMIFVTDAPRMYVDVVRFGICETGVLTGHAAAAVAFA
jgi:hypothetical protein